MDNFAPEIHRSLNLQGFMTRVDPTQEFALRGGRADVLVLKNGRSCALEIKSGNSSYDFTKWEDNQRAWSTIWCEDYSQTPYWIALIMGEKGERAVKKGERQAWFIPKTAYLEFESLILPIQNSIPYRLSKNHKIALREHNLDALNLFKDYALDWSIENRLYYNYEYNWGGKTRIQSIHYKVTDESYLKYADFLGVEEKTIKYWKFPTNHSFLELFK